MKSLAHTIVNVDVSGKSLGAPRKSRWDVLEGKGGNSSFLFSVASFEIFSVITFHSDTNVNAPTTHLFPFWNPRNHI